MSYRRRRRNYRLLVLWLVIIFCTIGFTQNTLLTVLRINGSAMEPAVIRNDYVYASKLFYGSRRGLHALVPQFGNGSRYGDLIVLTLPYSERPNWIIRFADICVRTVTFQAVRIVQNQQIVRRVIALPGDQIHMQNFEFYVAPRHTNRFISEFQLSTVEYRTTVGALPQDWKPYYPFSATMEVLRVPHAMLFVAADNRTSSLDSRHWGAIPAERIVAPLFAVYRFPFTLKNARS